MRKKEQKVDIDSIFGEQNVTDKTPSASESSSTLPTQKSSTLWAKILALICAIVVWVYATSVDTTTSKKDFSGLSVTNKYAAELVENYNISVISGNDALVNVTIEGKKTAINSISEDDITTYVDLSGITEAGEYSLKVNVNAPNGVKVTTCSPSTVTVFVDEEISASKPVKVSKQYVTANTDYMVSERIDTPSIMVTGPKSVVDSVDSAMLTIDLGTLNSSVDVVSRAVLVDKYGNEVSSPFLRMNINEISVHYSVEMNKTINLITELKNGTLGSNQVDVKLSQDTIDVKGSIEDLNALDDYVFYTVDEELLYNDVFSSTARLTLPEGIENLSDVSEITVNAAVNTGIVRRIPLYLDAQSLADCGISVKAPEGFDYSFIDSYITISVRSARQDFETMPKEEILSSLGLTIDLSDIGQTGNVKVPLNISPAQGLDYFTVYSGEKKDDYSVAVRLSK